MKADLLYRLIWMSRPLMQAAEVSVEKGLVGTGLTVRMRAVLEMLHTHGDLTVPDIAAKLHINRQYVQLMVNETLSEGFAIHRPNPRHKRSPLIEITTKGRALIDRVMTKEMELMRAVGAGIDESEAEVALRVIAKLTTQLKSHSGDEGR